MSQRRKQTATGRDTPRSGTLPGAKKPAETKLAAKKIGVTKHTVKHAVKHAAKKRPPKAKAGQVVLLSGGNPQIAKADGDAPVQAYIAAMPGWKRDVGRRLDALIVRTLPGVRKAVRWNTPFYGVDRPDSDGRNDWFLGFHCIAKYIKVAFFRGTALRPMPPVESKQKHVRYLHIHEGDAIDEPLVSNWIRQASKLPGEDCF
ncbi:MAG TPA: DUF1801 domain-containing protein [Tepidisphaeraceae bacterium]|nr:DUF1801 domain-containing protein [Tepidisphaeraceae bacterium]